MKTRHTYTRSTPAKEHPPPRPPPLAHTLNHPHTRPSHILPLAPRSPRTHALTPSPSHTHPHPPRTSLSLLPARSLQWAELALLLVTSRLGRALEEPTKPESPLEGGSGGPTVGDVAEVGGGVEVNGVGDVVGGVDAVGGAEFGSVVGVDGGIGGVVGGGAGGGSPRLVGRGREAVRLREACVVMTSRLTDLDPMHGRFYEFVERGGSVWGSRRGGALAPGLTAWAVDVGSGEGPSR